MKILNHINSHEANIVSNCTSIEKYEMRHMLGNSNCFCCFVIVLCLGDSGFNYGY